MITVSEIKALKEYLVNVYHSKRVRQQADDENFTNDNFSISYLPDEVPKMATGKAYRMVSAPAEHIITSNPQLFRTAVKNSDTDSANRIAKLGNKWLRILSQQNPNPFKLFVKKLLGQGEGWIYVLPNEEGLMPFDLIIPDPKIIYEDDWAGEVEGVPERILVCYDRIAENIKRGYPDFKWLNQKERKWSEKIPYFMYIDKDVRYIEADGEPLLKEKGGEPYNGSGLQENFYGFVPFVHAYAGFGETNADGDPASLCKSRITHCRDLIREYTAIRSVINFLIFQFAYPPLDYQYDPTTGFTPPPEFAEKYDRSPKSLNIVPVTPGSKGMVKGVDQLPDAQLFNHLYNVEKQIDEEDPLGLVGQVSGTSGRQQIDAKEASLRRYDTVVENTSHAFETAFSLMFKMCNMRPSLYPEELNKNDFKDNYSCTIELRSEDPIEAQITRADGDRKFTNGVIDWETNLTQYQGYTQEQAQRIMDKRIVDDVVMNDPVIRQLIATQIAREMGLEEQYKQLETMLGQSNAGAANIPKIGSQGGEPRQGNIKTSTGMEQMDMSLAQRPIRNSPEMGV